MFLSQHIVRQISRQTAANCLGIIEAGIYYGYPACCIEEFFEHRLRMHGNLPDHEPMAYHAPRLCNGSGFQPCKHCNGFKTRLELETEINQHRLCKEPFPEGRNQSLAHDFQELSKSNELLQRYVAARPQARQYMPLLINAWSGNVPINLG
jgi:hypothetical protein